MSMPSSLARRARALVLAPAAVLLAGALVGVAARPVAAQPPAGGPGRGPGAMMAMLFEGITLSDAQRAQVDSIQGAARARMMAQMAAGQDPRAMDDAARAEWRRQRQAEMQAQRDALRALLTADQQKTFDGNAARMQERARARTGGAGGPGGGGGRR